MGTERTSQWINNMKKEVQKLEEGLESDIQLESLIVTLKKVPN